MATTVKYLGIILVICFILPAVPALGFQSTFDSDKDGWRYFLPERVTDPGAGIIDGLAWQDGYVFNDQPIDEPWTFIGPMWEDWRGLYGGKIFFDLIVEGAGDFNPGGRKLILDLPGPLHTFAYLDFNVVQKDVWVTYEFDILDHLYAYGASVPNPEIPISGRMEEFDRLLITGDWLQGAETVCLDNVRMVPLPAPVVLLGTGLLCILGTIRRKWQH